MSSTAQPRPKVLMFDIGGVCVVSPFQAILDYETKNGIPKGYINYAIRALTPHGVWHRLERGEIPNDAAFMRAFKADLERPDIWAKFHRERLQIKDASKIPPMPSIDAETLYWTMMSTARQPDPYMYPALKRLKASGRYKLAALSNTTIFPEGHEYNVIGPDDVRHLFEVFVSSAHVGMRKPNRDIYEYALKLIRERWGRDIAPQEIVFLDDIGENLKTARSLGMRTIRVVLGRTDEAVRELERVTGLELLDGSGPKARL
ncbi:microsomal epoxide hydrolase [Capronia coronata CBS 617.96]|uniref:Microsomal epoxide hydrolase n=1 Tax=Capronia coronata CBS 617.96 TaxID=1182541 RepID=W9YQE4_9EURO|nr:microsomal epoxide hydrolase [Capronia coronata CBS 617.96]EXJ95147.1 microsomal epoxide hydrolase [Capronia coronata CBS 617.96]